MRVALVQPPLRSFNNRRMPIGLMGIASSLREIRPQDEIKIVDESLPWGTPFNEDNLAIVVQRIVQQTMSCEPQVVGLACMTSDFWDVVELAELLKSQRKDLAVVVGGPHASLRPMEFFEHSDNVDYVCTGDAEHSFPEFISALESKERFDVRGVWQRRDGEVVQGGFPDLIENLDSLPFPAYDLVDMDKYLYPDETTIRPLIISGAHLMSSRGCPYLCTFCTTQTLTGRGVRYKSPARVVDEIELLRNQWHIDGFYFYDDTFTLKKKHTKGICEELVRRKIDLPWGCQTRVNTINEPLVVQMKEAGCVQMEFGVEAGNERGWHILKKEIKREQVVSAFALANKMGIRTLANFMVNIPGETEQDIQDIQNLIREIKPTAYLANVMCPYPGTPIAEERGGIGVDEYVKLRALDMDDFHGWLDTKWRWSAHTLPAREARARVYSTGRTTSLVRFLVIFDGFYGWKHLVLMLKSKRTGAYFKQCTLLMLRRMKRVVVEGRKLAWNYFRRKEGPPVQVPPVKDLAGEKREGKVLTLHN